MANRSMTRDMENTKRTAAGTPAPGFRPPAPPAPAAQSKPSNRNMTERKAPILFKFESPGAFLEGTLLRVDRVEVGGKTANQYTFDCEDGEVRKILGTYDLDTKLRWPADRGKFIRIVFAQVRQDVARNGNPMREFLVQVEDKAPVPAPAPVKDRHEITDEDIGF